MKQKSSGAMSYREHQRSLAAWKPEHDLKDRITLTPSDLEDAHEIGRIMAQGRTGAERHRHLIAHGHRLLREVKADLKAADARRMAR